MCNPKTVQIELNGPLKGPFGSICTLWEMNKHLYSKNTSAGFCIAKYGETVRWWYNHDDNANSAITRLIGSLQTPDPRSGFKSGMISVSSLNQWNSDSFFKFATWNSNWDYYQSNEEAYQGDCPVREKSQIWSLKIACFQCAWANQWNPILTYY